YTYQVAGSGRYRFLLRMDGVGFGYGSPAAGGCGRNGLPRMDPGQYSFPDVQNRAGSEEVRALQRSTTDFQTEMPITTRARPHEPAWNWGTAAKERRI